MSVFELPKKPTAENELYERDFYSWTLQQAELLREGRLNELDIANIAEEIEGLARTEFRSLVSALRVLMLHMLKWDSQPEKRSRSWLASISEQRDVFSDVLSDSPGLKPRFTEALQRAYTQARRAAAAETGLKIEAFPGECPYSMQDLTARPFNIDPK